MTTRIFPNNWNRRIKRGERGEKEVEISELKSMAIGGIHKEEENFVRICEGEFDNKEIHFCFDI